MESLLNNTLEDYEQIPSLLSDFDPETGVTDEDKRNAEMEERKKFFLNPENQAEILMKNYLMSNPDMVLSGKQRRNLKREFLRNAKKGKYRKMFERQAESLPSEETKETFKNLNA